MTTPLLGWNWKVQAKVLGSLQATISTVTSGIAFSTNEFCLRVAGCSNRQSFDTRSLCCFIHRLHAYIIISSSLRSACRHGRWHACNGASACTRPFCSCSTGPAGFSRQWNAVARASLRETHLISTALLQHPAWCWLDTFTIFSSDQSRRSACSGTCIDFLHHRRVKFRLKDILNNASITHKAERRHSICQVHIIQAR